MAAMQSTTIAIRSYRIYLRDAENVLARSRDFELASDEEARDLATRMLAEQTTQPCVEVWDRARLVCAAGLYRPLCETLKMHDNIHDPRLAYRVNTFCKCVGLGRTKFYELVRDGKIKTVIIGGRRLIPATEAERLLSEGAA